MSPEDADTHEPFRHGGRLGPLMVVDVSVGAFPTWWQARSSHGH